MLAAAIDLARKRGLTVLTGRAVEGAGTYRPIAHALVGHLRGSPLGEQEELRPYRAALRRLIPGTAEDWVAPERGGGDPLPVLGEGLVRLLGASGAGGGCLLVLEDLHWADADTLALVDYLAGSVQDSPVLLVGSARDDWPGAAAVDRLTPTPGALPGARAPHADVDVQGRRISTLDLFDGRLTLLTGGRTTAWDRAAHELAATGLPIAALGIGRDLPDPDGTLARLFGIGDTGAVLVRPDGHVAWRQTAEVPDSHGELHRAIGITLGQTTPVSARRLAS